MSTDSANLTLLGWFLSLAFLAADSRADFRLELWNEIPKSLRNSIYMFYERCSYFRYGCPPFDHAIRIFDSILSDN